MVQIREMWITWSSKLIDPISHTQTDWLADKIQGIVAGAVRDDAYGGGE